MAEVPFKEGALTIPLVPFKDVRLLGVKCLSCGVIILGKRDYCINCASKDLKQHIFTNRGKVYMHTIIRHAPPPPYPQESFRPFPAAWIELEDGLVIISELMDCGLDDVKTGMSVELVIGPGWKDDKGNDVIMYKFKPIK